MTKRARNILIISLTSAFVLVLATVAFLALMHKPIYKTTMFDRTLERLLPDTSELEELIEEWEENGSEQKFSLVITNDDTGLLKNIYLDIGAISYGAGSKIRSTSFNIRAGDAELPISVIYDDEKVAIGGLSIEGDYIIIPLKDINGELKRSVFSPTSGSEYALNQEAFDELVNTLENFFESDSQRSLTYREQRQLYNSLGKILTRTKKKIATTTETFDRYGIEVKRVEHKLDKNSVLTFINAIAKESEKCKPLRSIIGNIYYTKSSDGTIGGISPLELGNGSAVSSEKLHGKAALLAFAEDFDNALETFNMTITYETDGDVFLSLDICIEYVSEKGKHGGVDILTDFTYDEISAGFDTVIKPRSDVPVAIEYMKKASDGGLDVTLELSECNAENVYERESLVSLKLSYDCFSGEFFVIASSEPLDFYAELQGTYFIDVEERTLELAAERIIKRGDKYYSEPWFELTVNPKPHGRVSMPSGKRITRINEKQFKEMLRALPIYTVDNIYYNLTEGTFGILYTNDQYIVFNQDDVISKANGYIQKYVDYYSKPEKDKDGNYIRSIYFYDEENDIYILLTVQGRQCVVYLYVNMPEDADGYHKAYIDKYGKIAIYQTE